MTDMTTDIFAEFGFGKLALKKMGPVHDNFRLYISAWNKDFSRMSVTGAEFKPVTRGENKGKLSNRRVPGTVRKVILESKEILEYEQTLLSEEEKPRN